MASQNYAKKGQSAVNSSLKSRKKTKKRKSWLSRYFNYHKLRLFRLRAKPQAIARGLAVGAFAGCFPFFGLQMIMAVLLAVVVRGNKLAAVTGTWISNPLTYIPIFLFNFQVGKLFLLSLNLRLAPQAQQESEFKFDSWGHLRDAGIEVTATLLLGSFIVGSIVGLTVYFVTLIFFARKNNAP